jgi:hypothetical protein
VTSGPRPDPIAHAQAFADLANRVSDLEDHLRDAQHALRMDDDWDVDASSRTSVVAGFRLDDAAGQLRSVMNDLIATAGDLQRIGRRTDRTCEVLWGVCPVHGATLQGTGGRCWCNAPGCEREWDYDRMRLPCTEDAALAVTFHGEVKTVKLCAGHADFLAPDANVTRTPIPQGA